jgi:hypothetical protein
MSSGEHLKLDIFVEKIIFIVSQIKFLFLKLLCSNGSPAQWEHFIQKGGRNFFFVKILLFMGKIMIFIVQTPSTYFGKNSTGQNSGKNALHNANIDSR